MTSADEWRDRNRAFAAIPYREIFPLFDHPPPPHVNPYVEVFLSAALISVWI